MKFFVCTDATGHPAVFGETRLHKAQDVVDVVAEYPDYDSAMQAVTDMRASRHAIASDQAAADAPA